MADDVDEGVAALNEVAAQLRKLNFEMRLQRSYLVVATGAVIVVMLVALAIAFGGLELHLANP